MSFVNLHAHSHYSLLDGYGSPKAIVLRAKELGYPAAALTDHGVTYGLIEFYKAAKAEGIKPILGCELYVSPRTRFDKEAKIDNKPYHLTCIAKNNTGYKNLLQLVTKAHLEGFYYKPRVDYGLLKTYSEGLIVSSGCLAGHLPRTILSENEKEIKRVVEMYIEIFGKDHYFLEIQDNPLLDNQQIVNARIKKLAKEYDLDLIATTDSHYPRPADSDVHDLLLCIQTGSTVNDEGRMRYTGDFSIPPIEDLRSAFADCPEAIENTLKIADMCNVDFDFGKNLIPHFPTPQNEAAEDYLRSLCSDGLKARFKGKEVTQEYWDRLDFELKTVNDMGFDTYFLIVHDFVKFAKDSKIVVGPGRGSAAGSIIAWSLNITDLDPIHYGLFFERFLNPERVSMPDIDIDFADTRRDEVLNYVVDKYGRDKVAQIITFGTMAPRAAIRDSGRALGYPYAEVDVISKSVPPAVLGKSAPLTESIVDDPVLKDIYKNDKRAQVLLDYAKRLEGTVRHVGTHACAVVISEQPLPEYTALQHGASSKNEVVTQFSANPLEDLGLLKMDFLGLRNLTVIEKTCEILKDMRDEEVIIDEISLEDDKTFELLQRAETTGVFQLESGGMKRYLKELKPNKFDDIVAMGALYRPGPMEWIPTYIAGKHNPEKVKYLDESFKSILETTYGVAVYQEQILQIARDFAGFTLGEADILRKAVGKKIASLLVEQREKFVKGAVTNGHNKKFALKVFEKVIEPFAGYGFNKAHAACYGMIAYQTAYLKAHYPVEFMTALLCSDATNTERVVLEIKECSEMGIDVLPPSVNESFTNFTVTDKDKIRFGLLAIKGVGEGPVGEVIAVREAGGPFKSLEDLATRVPSKVLNKKFIQAMARAGALDEFGDRNQLAESYEDISKFAKVIQDSSVNGQTSIFGIMEDCPSEHGTLSLRDVPKSRPMERLRWEKDFLGMYVSGHPLRGLGPYLKRRGTPIGSITKKKMGKDIKVVGLISGYRKLMTKAGKYMATFTVEDTSARVSGIMFPRDFNNYGDMLAEDKVVALTGKLDDKRGECQIMCNSAKMLSIETIISNAKESGTFDPDEKMGFAVPLLDDLLSEQDIEDPISLVINGDLYRINVPDGTAPKLLQSLNELLVKHKGDFAVEIFLNDADKTIKLPFGVNFSEELKKKVDSLLIS